MFINRKIYSAIYDTILKLLLWNVEKYSSAQSCTTIQKKKKRTNNFIKILDFFNN